MKKLFRGYRIQSPRLRGWDYCSGGRYFITICTANRQPHFGVLESEVVIETDAAQICRECWKHIPIRHPIAEINDFIIMPDHVHGIIQLIAPQIKPSSTYQVPTNHLNLPMMLKNSLGSIVNHFKGHVTKRIRRELDIDFKWQSGYNDVILRHPLVTMRARRYIRNNPSLHTARIRRIRP